MKESLLIQRNSLLEWIDKEISYGEEQYKCDEPCKIVGEDGWFPGYSTCPGHIRDKKRAEIMKEIKRFILGLPTIIGDIQ